MISTSTKRIPLKIKKLDPQIPNPDYASLGSAGFDLRAYLPNGAVLLKAGSRDKIPTGLQFVIPEGYEVQIRPRSGLAFKNGISLTNSPGTIDSDYRGEIQILIINHGKEDFEIKHGDRIAQAVIMPVYRADFIEISELPEETQNTRSAGGFGSTGIR
jgi:dUTP pyrophosphatase